MDKNLISKTLTSQSRNHQLDREIFHQLIYTEPSRKRLMITAFKNKVLSVFNKQSDK